MGAVLWAGAEAVASHETAAALWGIVRDRLSPVHVTVERKRGAAPRGVQTHVVSIEKRDRGKLRAIPVTSPARTLLDLAATRNEEVLLPLVERTVLDGIATVGQLEDIVQRYRGRPGCRRPTLAVGAAGSSALERRIEASLRGAGLPAHEREFAVGRFRLDFAWPSARVAVEADGRRWHSSAADFERDRAKHNLLVDQGWRVLRVTWRDLDDPATWLTPLAQWL